MPTILHIARAGLIIVVIVLLCAWLVGLVFTDRFLWSQWLWWIPTQAAIIAAGLGLIIALIPGESKRRWLIRSGLWLGLFAGIVCWFTLVEHRMLRSVQPIDHASTMRIMHINASRGYEDNAGQIGQAINRVNPDVVIFSFAWWSTNRIAQATEAGNAYQKVTRRPFSILSKHTVTESREIVNNGNVSMALIEIDVGQGRSLRMLLVDLPSDPRIGRAKLAREVRGWLDEAHITDVDLVLGDFNMTRGSASLKMMFPGFENAFTTAGAGYGATFPSTAIYHIDNTLHRPDLQISQYFVSEESLGPHRAQVIDIPMESLAD